MKKDNLFSEIIQITWNFSGVPQCSGSKFTFSILWCDTWTALLLSDKVEFTWHCRYMMRKFLILPAEMYNNFKIILLKFSLNYLIKFMNGLSFSCWLNLKMFSYFSPIRKELSNSSLWTCVLNQVLHFPQYFAIWLLEALNIFFTMSHIFIFSLYDQVLANFIRM